MGLVTDLSKPLAGNLAKPLTGYEASGGGDVTFQATVPETEFEIICSRYSGSGNLLNAIESPHSGASQSAYDFIPQGSPTFSTNKFTMDGTNNFKVASNSTWVESLHKDAGAIDLTLVALIKTANNTFFTLLGTCDHAQNGFQFVPNLVATQVGFQLHVGGSRVINEASNSGLLTTTGTHTVAISTDGSAQTCFEVIDGTKTDESYASNATTANSATSVMHLMCTHNGTSIQDVAPSGTELYGIIGINKTCSIAEVQAAEAHLNTIAGV